MDALAMAVMALALVSLSFSLWRQGVETARKTEANTKEIQELRNAIYLTEKNAARLETELERQGESNIRLGEILHTQKEIMENQHQGMEILHQMILELAGEKTEPEDEESFLMKQIKKAMMKRYENES